MKEPKFPKVKAQILIHHETGGADRCCPSIPVALFVTPSRILSSCDILFMSKKELFASSTSGPFQLRHSPNHKKLPMFKRLLSRRWLLMFLGTTAILFGVAM
jgi:hypothetical protein